MTSLSLEEKHTAAIAVGDRELAVQLRSQARKRAARRNEQPPAWAVLGAAPPPKREALHATITEYISQPVELPPAQPVELPADLRAWAHAGDRALCINPATGAVTLIKFCPREEARFSSEAAALAAIATGTIAWRLPGARRGDSPWRGRPRAA